MGSGQAAKQPLKDILTNGFLAGLVAITCPCDWVDPMGAFFIGIGGGLVVVWGIDLLEYLRIDDPIGAVTRQSRRNHGAFSSMAVSVEHSFVEALCEQSAHGLVLPVSACWSGAVVVAGMG